MTYSEKERALLKIIDDCYKEEQKKGRGFDHDHHQRIMGARYGINKVNKMIRLFLRQNDMSSEGRKDSNSVSDESNRENGLSGRPESMVEQERYPDGKHSDSRCHDAVTDSSRSRKPPEAGADASQIGSIQHTPVTKQGMGAEKALSRSERSRKSGDDISLCPVCNCMTKTVGRKPAPLFCGKCGATKEESNV